MNFDTAGNLMVDLEGKKRSYVASVSFAINPFSGNVFGGGEGGAADFFTLQGCDNTVRVNSFKVSAYNTSVPVQQTLYAITRTTLPKSGPGYTPLTAFHFDLTDTAAGATPAFWTSFQASGGLGFASEVYAAESVSFLPPNSGYLPQVIFKQFGQGVKQPVLRGSGQLFSVAIDSPGNLSGKQCVVGITVEWTEESNLT